VSNEENINIAKCMVEKNHLGYDTWINVCTGKQWNVDWTGLDWAGAALIAAVVLFALAVIVGVFTAIVKNS